MVGWGGFAHPEAYLTAFSFIGVPVGIVATAVLWAHGAWEADRAAGNELRIWHAFGRGALVAGPRLLSLWSRLLIVLGLSALVFMTFTGWRVAIPSILPFAWDDAFDRLDRLIHGGVRPWVFAHAIIRSPAAVAVVEWWYSKGWFLANIAVVMILPCAPAGRRSHQILVAYVLQYIILGTALAILFSSAGPVYYGRVLGLSADADPYSPLMEAVGESLGPEGAALALQEMLWHHYESGTSAIGTGITAFPSIHVSSAVLLALACWSWRRWVGAIAWAQVVLTVVGSVYLGWHYAVDSYFSIFAMLALWFVAGRLVRYPGTGDDVPQMA